MKTLLACVVCSFVVLGAVQTSSAATPAELLKTIRSVGKEAKGNAAAQAAMKELVKADASALPEVLAAFKGANPLAANWLRAAVETIADKTVKSGGKLPVAKLSTFLSDRKNDPRARFVAYEWLTKVTPKQAEKLVPGMLDDPSADLRRVAVQRLIDASKKLDAEKQKAELTAVLKKALSGAVEDDQVKAIATPLKKLGVEVDLQKHFGFLTQWQIIGPFDNKGGKGFDVAYPPEKALDLKAEYDGQLGKVKWQPVSTNDPYGIVDIAKSLKNYKGSAMYATTTFDAAEGASVQFRIGTPNSWKLWVNGKQIFGREEYHRGMVLDQYQVTTQLKPGKNVILLKILQNEQDDSWAQRYRYQIRVCDASGTAILPTKSASTKSEE